MGGACNTHERFEKWIKKFWSENLKGRNHSEDLGIDGKIILERILWKQIGKVWTGFIWVRIGTYSDLL